MNTFSKPVIKTTSINWMDYYENKIDLKSYKIPNLKIIAKFNRLYVSGAKPILIKRITDFFAKNKNASKIQSIFRKHLVKLFMKICGNKTTYKKCVNDSDFYTMENLCDIPFNELFYYTDNQNFTYGFQINSIINLFKKQGCFKNPYNRESFDISVVKNVLFLLRMNNILFGKNYLVSNNLNVNIVNHPPPEVNIQLFMNILSREDVLNRIEELKTHPLETRIENIFVEMDTLGNYTQSSWLSSLNQNECSQFIQNLYDIWNFRYHMSYRFRQDMCPYYNPFYHNLQIIPPTISVDDIEKYTAVTIIENIIFSGGNIENIKIGVIHILTALTIVSFEAREALPWLYESTVF